LLLRYANNSFSPTFITTIGIDFKIKTMTVDEKKIKLQVRPFAENAARGDESLQRAGGSPPSSSKSRYSTHSLVHTTPPIFSAA